MEAIAVIILVLTAAALAAVAWRRKRARPVRTDVPQDTVLLFQFARGPLAPSVSPFPLKLETFLRLTGVPYMNDYSGRMSSKGKIPWMQYNGLVVEDSQFCLEFLKERLHLHLDSHLSPAQTAAARAFLKLTEENLYWTMCYELFVRQGLAAVGRVLPYTGLKLLATGTLLSLVLRLEMWGHGIGRHSDSEIWDIARRDLQALSSFLGQQDFLMGEQPSEVDCAVFGMLCQVLFHMPDSRHQHFVTTNLPNLVDYVDRMKDRFWPDWDERCTASPKFKDDSGKVYRPEVKVAA